jgi:16S rRNA (guanine527-N7)-methyltransferase
LLVQGLAELGANPREDLVEKLSELAELLALWRTRINLTGYRSAEAIVRYLVLDAAALASALPSLESLADLGSGAGFPGLPIALLRPGCALTILESRKRPHHFQREAVRRLGIQNVRLRLGRAEQLEPEPHAGVVAQAVARPQRALRWMLRWAEPGGLLLIPGSSAIPQIAESEGVSEGEPLRYRVPLNGPERTLWIGHRSLQ